MGWSGTGSRSNPQGRTWPLATWTWIYVGWSLLPVLLLLRLAFADPAAEPWPSGLSLAFFRGALSNPELRGPLLRSLQLAGLTVAIATPLGVGLAIGLARWRTRWIDAWRALAIVPLAVPQVVLATGLFFTFLVPLQAIGFGRDAQLLGHVTIALPYVVLVVWVRLGSVDREFEELAMDLGASPSRAFTRVGLPLLTPAVVSAAAIAFVLSFDNLVLSQWLCIADCRTIPMTLFVRGGVGTPSPTLVALGTLAMGGTMLAMGVFFAGWRVGRRWTTRRA